MMSFLIFFLHWAPYRFKQGMLTQKRTFSIVFRQDITKTVYGCRKYIDGYDNYAALR